MQKLVRFFGRPLFFYFSFFFIFNANGQLISEKMERDFREDARIKVARVAKMIDHGVERYEKEGPQGFVESFGSALSPSDKSAILKEFKGLPPMPRVKMEGNNLVFLHKNKKIAEFDSYDVAQGIYQSGEVDLFYDSNMSLVENIEAWKKASQNGIETSSFFWMNLILPQAEAKNSNKRMIPLMFAVGIIGMIFGHLLGKLINKPKVQQHNQPSNEPGPKTDHSSPTTTDATPSIAKAPAQKSTAIKPLTKKEKAELLRKAKELNIPNPENLNNKQLIDAVKEKEKK